MKSKLKTFIALSLIIGGVFIAYLTLFAAGSKPINNTLVSQDSFVKQKAPTANQVNTLIIPKISINALINPNGVATLKDGAIWHRVPENGDPEKGGNFVLAGHRYVFSLNPNKVREESVLYNLHKLTIGDKIIIDWNKQRYNYVIIKTYSVKPTDTVIEAKSTEPKLTLYTCTLNGSTDGRIVVEATLQK